MKVIDLYNMVSNGVQPKRFIYKGREYLYSVEEKEFRSSKQEYRYGDVPEYVYLSEEIDLSNLNDEVEILEEENKIPETLDMSGIISLAHCAYKINEIIDYLKSKGE